jgi:hypothetical protein
MSNSISLRVPAQNRHNREPEPGRTPKDPLVTAGLNYAF